MFLLLFLLLVMSMIILVVERGHEYRKGKQERRLVETDLGARSGGPPRSRLFAGRKRQGAIV